MKTYTQRTYRNNISESEFLTSFRVVVKETDLLVRADRQLTVETEASIIRYRRLIEEYIDRFPSFLHTLTPFPDDQFAPPIVRDMIKAGKVTGVGPMASVAGAIAEWVGRDLLKYSQGVIIENGGDIFIKTDKSVTVGIFAGSSPLSDKVGIEIDPDGEPIAVCTSSGTVGHSLSMGKTDAVTVVSRSASLADAAATAVGNMVSEKTDIDKGINFTESVAGVIGVVIVIGDMIGFKGNLKLVHIG